MKIVRLPIYEDGYATKAVLEVDIRYFTTGPGRHFGKVIEPTPVEEELEMVDRIISGLPPRVGYMDPIKFQADADTQKLFPESGSLWDFLKQTPIPSAHFTLEKDGTVTQNVELGDVNSKYQEFTEEDLDFNKTVFIADNWRPIPGFSHYEMNLKKKVVTAKDGKSVSIMRGGSVDNVLLSDDNGNTKRMSVDWLFKKTFPEYK